MALAAQKQYFALPLDSLHYLNAIFLNLVTYGIATETYRVFMGRVTFQYYFTHSCIRPANIRLLFCLLLSLDSNDMSNPTFSS